MEYEERKSLVKKSISLLLSILTLISCVTVVGAKEGDVELLWPVKESYYINVLDRYSDWTLHGGIDISKGNLNQDVFAVAEGKVTAVFNGCSHEEYSCNCGDSYGNYVFIQHTMNGKTYQSRYAHLNKNSITVKKGDKVSAGKKIGKMGNSGNSTGHHLHFEFFEGTVRTREESGNTFQYYLDGNQEIIKKLSFAGHKRIKDSPKYGKWIKENCVVKDGVYYYKGGSDNEEPTNVASTLKIDITKYPTTINQGDSFGLRGTISSNYKISSVKGYVINSKGKTVISTSDSPKAKSLDVKTANLNDDMTFNELSEGSYTLKIVATDSYEQTKTWSEAFSVVKKGSEKTKVGVVKIPSSWDNLSIRTGPGTSYKIVGSMDNGKKCTVYVDKTKNGWYYVEYNGIKGYAAGNRIELK